MKDTTSGKKPAAQVKPGTGTFAHGMKIGDVVHKDFVLREANTDDLIAAEQEAPIDQQVAFNSELLALQLVRVGSFEGPFVGSMVRGLKAVDFWKLRAAQVALEAAAGEG